MSPQTSSPRTMAFIHVQHDFIVGSHLPAQPFKSCVAEAIIKLGVPKMLSCNAVIDRFILSVNYYYIASFAHLMRIGFSNKSQIKKLF